jgi:MFS family permease
VLGFYASAAQAGYLVATVATGILTARFGPRVPVVSGCLLLAVGAATIASAPGPILLAVGVIAAGHERGGAWAPFSDAIAYKVPTEETRRALSLVNAGSPVGLVVASVLLLVAGDRGGPCGGRSRRSGCSRPPRRGGCWHRTGWVGPPATDDPG